MKDRVILTIVIPVYNREHLVIRTLDSIACQECSDRIKVIVVDDNSTDLTFEAVGEWILTHPETDVTLLRTEVKGASAARNRGLAHVITPFTMFFDSDDRMMPGFLKRVVVCLETNEADIVGWDVKFTGEGKAKRIFADKKVWLNHLVHGALSTQRYVAKTSLFRAAGGWNEKLNGWTDYELGVRLLSFNPRLEKLKVDFKRTVEVNYTPDSITGTGVAECPEKWMDALDAVEQVVKIAAPKKLGWVQYRRAILAAEFNIERDEIHASSLLKKALEGQVIPRYVVKMIYNLHRRLRRGTWLIASLYCAK